MPFGGSIGLLSFVMSIDQPIQFNLDTNYGPIPDLVRIFKISDQKLHLNFNNPSDTISLDDNAKTFSSYIKPDSLNLFGSNFPIVKSRKPCIGVIIAPTVEMSNIVYLNKIRNSFDNWIPKYPHSKKHIDKIISLCLDLGYDIITFNSKEVTLDHKILMMNNLCDCLISYEGGMAHLAHCLDIPVIMFPWEKDFGSINLGHHYPAEFPAEFAQVTRAMLMHLDKKTYFLKSADDVLSWTADTLKDIKLSLDNNLGNNAFLSDNSKRFFAQLNIDDAMRLMAVPDDLKELVKNNLTHIGGLTDQ
jgi:hypothetical protein